VFGDHTNMEVGVARKLSISIFFNQYKGVDECRLRGRERK
jgi:hypothetical protein